MSPSSARFRAGILAIAGLLAALTASGALPARPVEQWRWDGPSRDPDRPAPIGTPLVVQLDDDDGDGDVDIDDTPDVLFMHYGAGQATPAVTALDGATGARHFSISDPPFTANMTIGSPLAAGDVDGDGLVEIIVMTQTSVLVFENDGTFGWSRALAAPEGGDGVSIGLADLDQDGTPEITVHAQAVSADGSFAWAGAACMERTCSNGYGQVADLRPDVPGLELIAGNTCYDARGNVLWSSPSVPDGAAVIGDLDGDGVPEIVLSANVHEYLHVLDPFGAERAPPTRLVAPTTVTHPILADFDGDELPEVVVPCGASLQAYDWRGGRLVLSWSTPVDDSSCCADGTAYDFDADGRHEVVYRDQDRWMIVDGCDGAILHEEDFESATAMESPVVANLDHDAAAEIVVSGVAGIGAVVNAVVAYEVPGSATPRAIWNQRTYHVSNVLDDGTIPRVEPPAWTSHRTWHAQAGPPPVRPALAFDHAQAADLSPCHLGIDVTWDAALLDGVAAAVEYDVHRSDDEGGATCADALAHAPIATGLTELRLLDRSTRAGARYAYVVVARSLEPCGPPPSSACTEPPVMDEADPPFPDYLGWPLRARHDGDLVTFAWPAARALLPGEHFHLKRALDSPTAPFQLVNGEGGIGREHSEVELGSWLQFFDLRAANACEAESLDDEPPSY